MRLIEFISFDESSMVLELSVACRHGYDAIAPRIANGLGRPSHSRECGLFSDYFMHLATKRPVLLVYDYWQKIFGFGWRPHQNVTKPQKLILEARIANARSGNSINALTRKYDDFTELAAEVLH